MTTIEIRPVPVSSSGLVKMEDRKRPASGDGDDSAPPSKRQVTAVVNGTARSHQDADLPGRDELEKFQKEAIMRQMQEYKREKVDIENRLNDLVKKSAHHDNHLRVMDAWFTQLLDEVKVIAKNSNDDAPYNPFPTQLLSSDEKSFHNYLQERSRDISAVLEILFSGDRIVTPETTELQERITQLLASEKSHINKLEKLQSEKDQIEGRLETASIRYMMAEKKLDRAKSMTVAKLERQAMAGGRSETGSGLGGETSKPDSANGQIDSEALAEVEKDKKAALAVSAKQAEQIEQMAAENEKLNSQLNALKLKSSSFSDDDYAHTDLFKQTKAQHDEVVKKLNHLEAANAELRHESTKHQSERSAYKMQLEAESQAAIDERDALLNKAEGDLARIRAARDELYADITVRKATMEQERTSVNQIKELVQARDERIKAYETEIERLKGVDAQPVNESGSNDDNLTLDELRAKHSLLERQFTMLNQELTSMSAAYKKISAANAIKVANLSELEEKVLRLGAEKAKADQKYFAAMKAKESKDNEVRALRAQNGKSSDIVSQLKDVEASTKSLVVKLEKQLAESNDAISTLQVKHRDAQSQSDQKKLSFESLKKQSDDLKSSVAAKESACAAATSAQRKVELQVEELKVELEEKNKRLETWKAKGLGSENEHYEVLRNLAICTVCRRNFKDTAIKTCGHVFCRECVEDRLSSRMRKCPNCNKAFGQTDHLKITL